MRKPVECGGVRADSFETKKFTHLDGENIYEIKLKGYRNGGLAFYTHYFKRFPFPKAYISGGTVNVCAGEEDEILSTGLRVRGT